MGNVSCFFIVIDQRFRLRFVNIDTIVTVSRLSSCSLDQLAAAVVANAFFLRRNIDNMEACAACFADSSSCQSCDQFILSYSDVKNLVDLAAMGCKEIHPASRPDKRFSENHPEGIRSCSRPSPVCLSRSSMTRSSGTSSPLFMYACASCPAPYRF